MWGSSTTRTANFLMSSASTSGVTFQVDSRPIPQGSLRARVLPNGQAVVYADNSPDLQEWRKAVAWSARAAGIKSAYEGPVRVVVVFDLPLSTSRRAQLKSWLSDIRPDVDKLARAVLDALTGVAYHDDAQVADLHVTKRWASPQTGGKPCAQITISPLIEQRPPAAPDVPLF